MKLSDFKILTFDCYGTLIDWESGLLRGLEPMLARLGSNVDRQRLLEIFADYETEQQRFTPFKPYRDLLPVVYKRVAEHFGVDASLNECEAFGASIANWPAFDDSAEALKSLQQHYKLVILSNVDNRSFAASNARLGVTFDAVFTAEDIGSYKPAPRNFDYMLWALGERGIGKGDILHTAQSLHHDHVPANACGLNSAWIDRRTGRTGGGATKPVPKMPRIDFRFNSMAEMAAAVAAEKRG